eukprot:Blabericola_migrator_1__6832@NODE_3460_length_1755_cov_280_616114_g2152_i0_p3_GENE_NODE_3460_length_1755_cov_280_616114_g2152_i0NODE_3460_length_1755_cov_280_616114_g2152_i0_p3_ORF_typecomplete_len165_score24_18DAZAP2/PF11029_8/6_2_NODE_3460_length_1755_cov_280_616114_g2152_i07521246
MPPDPAAMTSPRIEKVHPPSHVPPSMDSMASIEILDSEAEKPRPNGYQNMEHEAVTQPWLSTKVVPRKKRRFCHNPFHVREPPPPGAAIEIDEEDINLHYVKRLQQPWCATKDLNLSRSPSEFCRRNGFDRPLNALQILSWIFFGIDLALSYAFLVPSLHLVAA